MTTTRYRAEHNQELQGYFVEIPDSAFDPQYNQISWALPCAGNAAILLTQPQAPATGEQMGGTRVGRAVATGGTYLSKRIRTGYETAAGAGSTTGAAYFSSLGTGHLNGEAGFSVMVGGGLSIVNATYRWLMGLATTTSAPEPSTILNCILVGADTADTNAQLMFNDGVGTCTKIDLGPSFPARTLAATYNIFVSKEANSPNWNYIIRRLDAGISINGVLSGANLPLNTQNLFPIMGCNNGVAGGVVSVDVFGFYSAVPY